MIIVIDSTEYKQDRTFNKRNLALIKDYGRHGLINLHVPYIVYMEVLTTIINDLTQDLNQIKNSLSGLESKGLSAKDSKTVKSITKSVETILPKIEASSEILWKDFISESKATLHPLYEADSTSVFDSYFKGANPFKAVKSRLDIPDAYIYQTVLRLLTEGNAIHVISNDNNLRQSFDGIAKIKTHNSLKEFLKIDDFKALEATFKRLVYYSTIEESKDLLMVQILVKVTTLFR